ncbi:MAG: cation transporter [Candidatus Aenigmarchaeota archaeon]|nr:cation transporter [Candidatus Aenigmarchaeota archaeon]
MKDETIEIKGMHCNSCVKLIESKLSRLKGVERVKVSLPDEQASVRYDPKHISVAAMEQEIRELGYGAGPEGSFTASGPPASGRGRTVLQAVAYGLVPHIGCIGFIVATVLGVTVATQFFKPLLMNPYFFYILIGVSFAFATVSSLIYLKNQGFITLGRIGEELELNVSKNTLQKKWKYLTTMYGTTIGINLALFLFVFPMLANFSFAASSGVPTGDFGAGALSTIRLQVQIPCTGHAPLISGELKTLPGIRSVTFSGSNTFDVSYDPSATSKADILGLEVFKTYAATEVSESQGIAITQTVNAPVANVVSAATTSSVAAVAADGVQTVQLSVQGTTYLPNPVRVKKGVPVQLVADINNMPGCSKSIVIPEFGVSKTVSAGDNVITFTPAVSGTFQFSCSMGMYRGQLIVENADGTVDANTGSAAVPKAGSCGCGG